MANKRMFTMKICDSDAFLDMPLSTQCLYFHLNMRADDDGFIGNSKRIARLIGASDDDLKLLVAKRFVIPFEDGVMVIKHWRMHNTLSQNRYHETQYIEEKNMLRLKENGAYSLEDGAEIDDSKLIDAKKNYDNRHRLDIGSTSADSDLDLDLDIEEDIDTISASGNAPDEQPKPETSKKDIDKFFESIWSLYPNKKGKGQVSDSKKKTLYKIGIEEMTRAIDRYKTDLAKEDWRKPQNGSTFFNSGYVDYLDANYEPLKVTPQKPQQSTNRFNNFQQREYTKEQYEAIERRMLGIK
jgi:hypothetical protein